MRSRKGKQQPAEVSEAYAVCGCGGKHRLFPGLEGPLYWCGSDLRELKEGDTIEFEEREIGNAS